MMSSVEALPIFWIDEQRRALAVDPRRCWSAAESRCGRARRRGCRSALPPTVRIGRSFSSSIVSWAGVQIDVVFDVADLRRAARQDQVLQR